MKIALKQDDMIQMRIGEDKEWLRTTVINHAKVNGRYYNYFNVLGEDGIERKR